MTCFLIITARKRSLRRLCFYRCLSVRMEVCMVAGGGGMCDCQGVCVVARGCVWLSGGHAWLLEGMCGCWGACMVARGHVWLPGGMYVWLLGFMCGCQGSMCGCRGCVWLPGGVCGCQGMCGCWGHAWLPGGEGVCVVAGGWGGGMHGEGGRHAW